MENEILVIQLYLFCHLPSEGVLTCHYSLHNKRFYLLISLFLVALPRGVAGEGGGGEEGGEARRGGRVVHASIIHQGIWVVKRNGFELF